MGITTKKKAYTSMLGVYCVKGGLNIISTIVLFLVVQTIGTVRMRTNYLVPSQS